MCNPDPWDSVQTYLQRMDEALSNLRCSGGSYQEQTAEILQPFADAIRAIVDVIHS